MATAEQIAWAAGLFEGEGCISHLAVGGWSDDLQLALVMTDEDVVRYFDEIVDRGVVYGPYSPLSAGLRRKPFWRWSAKRDAAHDVLDLVGPWLFSRRRTQALERGVVIEAPRPNGHGLSP